MDEAGTSFQVDAPDPEFGGEWRINLFGRHQVVNALFAIAVGQELGVTKISYRPRIASRRRRSTARGKNRRR
jgi:UDP-N-acetylmuramyl pentapeptide synthase